jgi:hypothetical protein
MEGQGGSREENGGRGREGTEGIERKSRDRDEGGTSSINSMVSVSWRCEIRDADSLTS